MRLLQLIPSSHRLTLKKQIQPTDFIYTAVAVGLVVVNISVFVVALCLYIITNNIKQH